MEQTSLLAKGRAADVFEHSEGRVLRRYRNPHNSLYEAAVMSHVAEHGFPVPHVYEVSGTDMVMERLDGPTMLADFPKRPWMLLRHARTLAGLLHRLHEIPAPDWLEQRHTGGRAIVHLDLHPDNVMLAARGPVVIDWSNAGRGEPAAELADLWLISANASIPGSRFERALLGIGRGAFMRALLKRFDRDAIRAHLDVALELRTRDRNMSESELERMKGFVKRWGL